MHVEVQQICLVCDCFLSFRVKRLNKPRSYLSCVCNICKPAPLCFLSHHPCCWGESHWHFGFMLWCIKELFTADSALAILLCHGEGSAVVCLHIHLCASPFPLLSLSLCLRLTQPLPQCASALRLVLLRAVVVQVTPPARDRLRRRLKPSDSALATWSRSRLDPLPGHGVPFLGHSHCVKQGFYCPGSLVESRWAGR